MDRREATPQFPATSEPKIPSLELLLNGQPKVTLQWWGDIAGYEPFLAAQCGDLILGTGCQVESGTSKLFSEGKHIITGINPTTRAVTLRQRAEGGVAQETIAQLEQIFNELADPTVLRIS